MTALVFENSTPIPRSSSAVEKKWTKSVIEGVGDKASPSSEEKVGDSGNWSARGDNSPGKGKDCSDS